MSTKTPSFFDSSFDKFMRSLSIRYTLPLIMVTPLLVAVAAIGWFSFQSGQKEIDYLIKQVSEESTKIIKSDIESYLKKPGLLLQPQVASIYSGNLNLDNLSEMQRYFWQQLQQNNSLNNIFFGSSNGTYISVEKTGNEFVAKIRDESTDFRRSFYQLNSQGNRTKLLKSEPYDPITRPWYQSAQKSGKPAWSPIYKYSSNNVLGIDLTIPVLNRQTGAFQGALATNISLSQISDFLGNLTMLRSGKAFIMERTGNLVATSSREQPFKVVQDEQKRLNVRESQDPLIQAAGHILVKEFNTLAQIQRQQQLTFTFRGNSQFLQVTPLQDERGLDWMMVVVVPRADFTTHIDAYMRWTVFVGVVVAGVGIILGLMLVRWITVPIQDLYKAAKALESENFDASILETVASRGDEFGQLGKVFIVMANVIYSREQNWKKMAAQLQEKDSQFEKSRKFKNYQRQFYHLEELLEESQKIRTKIDTTAEEVS